MDRSDAAADWAGSGVVALTGHRAGPPLVPPGRGASVAAELGRLFDVDGAALLGERAAFTGWSRAGQASVGGASRLLPLACGWAAVSCARDDDVALLGALTGTDLTGAPSCWACPRRPCASRCRPRRSTCRDPRRTSTAA